VNGDWSMPEVKEQITAAAEAAQFGASKSGDTTRDGTPLTENGDSKPKEEVSYHIDVQSVNDKVGVRSDKITHFDDNDNDFCMIMLSWWRIYRSASNSTSTSVKITNDLGLNVNLSMVRRAISRIPHLLVAK
jgi:hypothetical protein